MLEIFFSSTDKITWLKTISNTIDSIPRIHHPNRIRLKFSSINTNKIQPLHIVSLACLIEFLDQLKIVVTINEDTEISNFLFCTLRMNEYWTGNQNYVKANDSNLFNLWRIVENEKEVHSMRIHDYLKQVFFKQKDLSAVKNSLDEAYYNIFDHAQANGNAFSFIKYDQKTEKLHVAVCDLGIGIAQSVRKTLPLITKDSDALLKALEYNFTTKSKHYNMGMGLGNIKDACTEDDILGIISNNGILLAKRDNYRTFDNILNFPGTLIFYELSLAHFENEEIINTFVW